MKYSLRDRLVKIGEYGLSTDINKPHHWASGRFVKCICGFGLHASCPTFVASVEHSRRLR